RANDPSYRRRAEVRVVQRAVRTGDDVGHGADTGRERGHGLHLQPGSVEQRLRDRAEHVVAEEEALSVRAAEAGAGAEVAADDRGPLAIVVVPVDGVRELRIGAGVERSLDRRPAVVCSAGDDVDLLPRRVADVAAEEPAVGVEAAAPWIAEP